MGIETKTVADLLNDHAYSIHKRDLSWNNPLAAAVHLTVDLGETVSSLRSLEDHKEEHHEEERIRMAKMNLLGLAAVALGYVQLLEYREGSLAHRAALKEKEDAEYVKGLRDA